MVYEVVWTDKADESFAENIAYLQERWSEREIKNFVSVVEEKLAILSNHPNTGSPRSQKHPNIRYTVLLKRISLIYRVKPKQKRIELLLFWNTYQHPSRLKIR